MDRHFLSPLFDPQSIVVFAGAEGGVPPTPAAAVLRRALRGNADADADNTINSSNAAQKPSAAKPGFGGQVTWLDVATTGTLADLANSRADLALIALPPGETGAALEIVGRIRCRAALVLGSGFSAAQSAELQHTARRHGVHLLGPNCLGLQRPGLGLNASLLGPLAAAGPLALVSQSGALTASILDWARQHGVGFSSVVSLGPSTAGDLPQVLDFLASDGKTQSILVYMEGIRHARRFMSALRAAASVKPVVVMKAGRQAAGSRVALTHSAAIVGADEVFDAALRRAGVVRVRQFTQLFSAAQCLASRFRPAGLHLAIVTNGGGPAVLAADWADELGLKVDNVQDLGEDADAPAYVAALDRAVQDRSVDGVLLIHSPKPLTGPDGSPADPLAIAQALADAFAPSGKPVLACWMGEATARAPRELLSARQMPVFRTPESAVDAFHSIATFYRNQQLLQQTPPPLSHLPEPDTEGARLLIDSVLAERRHVLTEMESKALLAAFHIPVTRTMLAHSANEAMLIASQLGYPVALKIDSPDIPHKSDVQGVVLNVHTALQVRDRYNEMLSAVVRLEPTARINGITVQPMARLAKANPATGFKGGGLAREVFIGMSTDDPFGPVIAFGAGGTMVELLRDRALELPPLNQFLARRLIERSRVATALGEWRGAAPADIQALEHVLLRVSEMVCALPQLREMDINPLIVDESGAVAVDARIVVDAAPRPSQSAPDAWGHAAGSHAGGGHAGAYPHLAILPYPASQEREWPLKGGVLAAVRPVRPDDADMLQAFVRGLSQESRYFRFASAISELPARVLARFTLIDYDREMALVAVVKERRPGVDGSGAKSGSPVETERLIGVSRYVTNPDGASCEFSLVVADDFKGQGLGTRLMLSIIDLARAKGLSEIMGMILTQNTGMLRLMASLGFQIGKCPEDPDFKVATKAL